MLTIPRQAALKRLLDGPLPMSSVDWKVREYLMGAGLAEIAVCRPGPALRLRLTNEGRAQAWTVAGISLPPSSKRSSSLDGETSSTPARSPNASPRRASTRPKRKLPTRSHERESASAPPMSAAMERRVNQLISDADENEDIKRMVACGLHLLDLKRAGFSAGHGEMRNPPDGATSRITVPVVQVRSFCGSPAAMCAG